MLGGGVAEGGAEVWSGGWSGGVAEVWGAGEERKLRGGEGEKGERREEKWRRGVESG